MVLEFLSSSSASSLGTTLVSLVKWILTAIVIGGLLGVILVFLLRMLSFKYGVIMFEKRANNQIVPYTDRARISKKRGIKKTIFMKTKGEMKELPFNFLYPTIKKTMFDMFRPKESFVVFSYAEGEFLPVDVAEDFGKFKFKPYDSGAEFWADMQRKSVKDKYNKDPFWKTPQFMILTITTAWLIGLALMIVFFRSAGAG